MNLRVMIGVCGLKVCYSFCTTAGAIVNALTRNKISDDRLEWFLDNLGEENTFIVPETVAIEGAFNQNHSVYGFEPTNRHREQKAEEVRDIYDRPVAHVEAHYG